MVPGRDNETPPDPEHLTIHQQMDIILLQDLEKVGEKYDVVTVKDGYGRNFLIPQKMAVIANTANMAKLDAYKDKIAEERAAKLATYQEQANKAANVTLKSVRKPVRAARFSVRSPPYRLPVRSKSRRAFNSTAVVFLSPRR